MSSDALVHAAASPSDIVVRPFARADVTRVLTLMRELAAFEGYLDAFRVTETDLIERGLSADPQFGVLVAHARGDDEPLAGIAVYHLVPFTYDLHPDLTLKELYVDPAHRGRGIAGQLMARLTVTAKKAGCKRIRWLVLHDNAPAKAFYASLGAGHDSVWEPWVMRCT